VCLSALAFVVWNVKYVFSVQHYAVICDLSGSTIFLNITLLTANCY
jgi:hypothetical protein